MQLELQNAKKRDRIAMPGDNQTVVLVEHHATYSDPLVVKCGERLTVTERRELWDGHLWIWAVADDKRAGWIPDDLAVQCEDIWRASRDYSAIELSCTPGDTVTIIQESHGWAWCTNARGEKGWLPLKCLSS